VDIFANTFANDAALDTVRRHTLCTPRMIVSELIVAETLSRRDFPKMNAHNQGTQDLV